MGASVSLCTCGRLALSRTWVSGYQALVSVSTYSVVFYSVCVWIEASSFFSWVHPQVQLCCYLWVLYQQTFLLTETSLSLKIRTCGPLGCVARQWSARLACTAPWV